MQMTVNDNICWLCGEELGEDRTSHHTLPRHLKPARNIMIPLHEKCHEKVTANDSSALINFAYKLAKEIEDANKRIGVLTNLLEGKTIGSILEVKKK